MYLSPWKFFRNQILLDYLGRWRNQSCQIFFQSVHSSVYGKASNFTIFSANRSWPLQLLYYRTTVMKQLDCCNWWHQIIHRLRLNCFNHWITPVRIYGALYYFNLPMPILRLCLSNFNRPITPLRLHFRRPIYTDNVQTAFSSNRAIDGVWTTSNHGFDSLVTASMVQLVTITMSINSIYPN